MLHEFLRANRSELIGRCRMKVASRRAPRATSAELEHGIPVFLDQLANMLERGGHGPDGGMPQPGVHGSPAEAQIAQGARSHGCELLGDGFTIDQVVHDYGDLCQSITELAEEKSSPITVTEFGILNIRLDNAIATAVTEYARRHEAAKVNEGLLAAQERLGVLAHEVRNLLNISILALTAIKKGGVGFGGATAAALDRSLLGMSALIDRTLLGVRLESASVPAGERIEMGQFFSEVRVAAALEASQRGCELTVEPVPPGLQVHADRHMLASAVSNLLQNAFKFTHPGTRVLLRALSSKDRVVLEVEDECGGLPHGFAERIFQPFAQAGEDRSGLGLGLSLSRRGIQAYGGALAVRNLPGQGCVFTIDLPRMA